jgi:hypothetical protein
MIFAIHLALNVLLSKREYLALGVGAFNDIKYSREVVYVPNLVINLKN